MRLESFVRLSKMKVSFVKFIISFLAYFVLYTLENGLEITYSTKFVLKLLL